MELLLKHGATDVLFVGGCVRDHLMGHHGASPDIDIDIDIEVYGLSYEQMQEILSPRYRVDLVGKSFGVIKVDQNIDLSIPRTESKLGIGHKGFEILSNPHLTFETAAARRDFTINAIGMRLDGTLVDPYHGVDDIRRKILRATSDAFGEDPLRVLRAMQFAARFGFSVDDKTLAMCRLLKSEFSTLSQERVWGEWWKWSVKSKFPSCGLEVLKQTTWIECFPQIARLIGTPQHPDYHQEGDVFEHIKMTVDVAANIAQKNNLPKNERAVLLFGALLHDIGKPETVTRTAEGFWTSPNHAAAGVAPGRAFLESMLAPHWLVDQVLPLIREHQTRLASTMPEASETAARRLAVRLAPSNIRIWAMLCESDATGCISDRPHRPLEPWIDLAQKLDVFEAPPKMIVQGRDLIPLGVEPGPEMGKILNRIFEAQLDGEFDDLQTGITWFQTKFKF